MPASDKHAALAACFRSNRKDLNVEKDLREEYFKSGTAVIVVIVVIKTLLK